MPPLGLHVYTHARTYKRTGIKQNASAAFMMGIEGPRTPRLTRTMGGHSPLSFSLATYFRVDHGSLTLFWTRSDPTHCVGDPTRSDPSCTRNCRPDPTRGWTRPVVNSDLLTYWHTPRLASHRGNARFSGVVGSKRA